MQTRTIFSLHTNDIDEMAATFGGQNLVAVQLSPGVFEGQLLQVQLDEIQFWRLSWNQKIQLLGNFPPETVSLWVPLTQNYRCIWKGVECDAHQIILNIGDRVDYSHLEGEFLACITFMGSKFLQKISMPYLANLKNDALSQGVLSANFVRLQLLRNYLGEIFSLAVSDSELLLRSDLNQTSGKNVLTSVAELLISSEFLPKQTGRSRNRTLKLKQTVEYIRENLQQPLSLQKISAEIGIGQRSLIYSFRKFFGMGLMEYCKSNRLNAVRRHLKDADAKTDNVSEIARKWGFCHMGHFSADYKAMFGELPSETLQRS